MFYHQLAEADRWLAAAESALRATGEEDLLLMGRIGAVKTDVALNRGDVRHAVALGESALTYLPGAEQYTRSYLLYSRSSARRWRLGKFRLPFKPSAGWRSATYAPAKGRRPRQRCSTC